MVKIVPNQRGFTLSEVLTVLALLAVTAGLAMPSLQRWQDTRRGEAAIERSFALMRYARARAVVDNRELIACIDQDGACTDQGRQLAVSDNVETLDRVTLPTGYSFRGNRPQWRFTPDGQAWPAGSLLICSEDPSLPAAKLVLVHTGRVRIIVSRNGLNDCT